MMPGTGRRGGLPTVEDAVRFIASLAPEGMLGQEEGVLFGEASDGVRGIWVSWMATHDVIATCYVACSP